jgi:hypothetical protein
VGIEVVTVETKGGSSLSYSPRVHGFRDTDQFSDGGRR